MKIGTRCYQCYFEQALSTLAQAGIRGEAALPYLKKVAGFIAEAPLDETPAYTSSLILQRLYREMGMNDPFAEAKAVSNWEAKRMAEKLKNRLMEEDPLLALLKLSAAGNVIDMGILGDKYDLKKAIAEVRMARFDPLVYDRFRRAVFEAESILIIGDNSGEIAFDVLLADHLRKMGKKVYYGVKSYPILNDATMKDAIEVGMTYVATVLENGNGFLGTIFDKLSPQFKEIFFGVDLILAKGQANFESLEGRAEAAEKTFFVLRVKCPYLAAGLGVELWDWMLLQNRIGGIVKAVE